LQDSFGSEVLCHLSRDLVEPKNAVMTTPEKDTKTKIIGVTLLFFLIAGLCEIGGGYLVWLWLRDGMSWMLGALGGFVLFLYGVVPTFQPSHFHRIYAAYGGIFIVMAVVWGWIFEGIVPDKFDIIGGAIALAGVAIIFYMPRKGERKAVWWK
jgi:small multidrug resistance family-3 protein